MFKILRKINSKSLLDNNINELDNWLDNKFFLENMTNSNPSDILNNQNISAIAKLNKFGGKIRNNCPKSLDKSLFYIAQKTTSYPNLNCTGKMSLFHIWPLFFEKFPNGQIWILEIAEEWLHEVWTGQTLLANQTGYNEEYPNMFCPQESSGLSTDFFPTNILTILAYGIYPLISCSYANITKFNLFFLYIPDQAFKYSQMTERRTNYQEILWDFHHIFDDQWTFDGSRGPKIRADQDALNPIKQQLKYFEWLIKQVNERMHDIINISDPFLREQLVMTINRAICDSQLCISSELPYMSKIFFFSCLDKLANIMTLINSEKNEANAWEKLLNEEFLYNEVLDALKDIKGNTGIYLHENVKSAVSEMRLDNISPQDLRDLRNTHHGYKLRTNTINRLMKRTGEFNNNITLIIMPLILFLMSKKWKI